MIFGIPTATYTFIHIVISLVGIFSGFVVLFGVLASKRLDGWYAFPTEHLLPSQVVGVISLVVLTAAIIASYGRHLAGGWRKAYVITAMIALYLNVFVAIVQAFLKVPSLKAMAPTQHEPPFLVAQVGVMALFVVLTIVAAIKFRDGAVRPA